MIDRAISASRGDLCTVHKSDSGGSSTMDADPVAAYDEMVKRATNAWRRPARDFAEPDMGTRPEELELMRRPSEPDPNAANAVERELETWQGRDPAELARDVEARRRAVHAEFCNTLSNAWRGGR